MLLSDNDKIVVLLVVSLGVTSGLVFQEDSFIVLVDCPKAFLSIVLGRFHIFTSATVLSFMKFFQALNIRLV